MARRLEGELRERVLVLCREGDLHAGAGEYSAALACYLEAQALLPEPREQWDAAATIHRGMTWVMRAGVDEAEELDLILAAHLWGPRPSSRPVA